MLYFDIVPYWVFALNNNYYSTRSDVGRRGKFSYQLRVSKKICHTLVSSNLNLDWASCFSESLYTRYKCSIIQIRFNPLLRYHVYWKGLMTFSKSSYKLHVHCTCPLMFWILQNFKTLRSLLNYVLLVKENFLGKILKNFLFLERRD